VSNIMDHSVAAETVGIGATMARTVTE